MIDKSTSDYHFHNNLPSSPFQANLLPALRLLKVSFALQYKLGKKGDALKSYQALMRLLKMLRYENWMFSTTAEVIDQEVDDCIFHIASKDNLLVREFLKTPADSYDF